MAFATKKLVCGLDYTLAMGLQLAACRPEPSSLYTFRIMRSDAAWLGIASSRLHETGAVRVHRI